jgi:sugar (pentulose or hexulose) kinase
MEKYILSIDCGTQSLRTLIFNHYGNLIAKSKIEYEPYYSLKPGYAEKNPEDYYQSLIKGTNELKINYPEIFNKIEAIAITTQRDTLTFVDSNGNPVRDSILWLDTRKARNTFKPNFLLKMGLEFVGMLEPVKTTEINGKINWLKQFEPENYEKTYKVLQVSGYLNFKLTGNFKDSIASQIGHIPFNYKKLRWSNNNELNYKIFPVENDKLPELVEPGSIIGYITEKASFETGLKKGISVIAAGSDKGCETIGMGVIDTNMASLSFGTTATIQTTSKKYFEPIKFMPAYPAPIKGYFNPEVEIFRGYWMIKWFKEEFCHKENEDAKIKGIPVEKILNDFLKDIPAGSLGLIVQPYWTPGLKFPSAKGVILGFGDAHKKQHLYKAVIEGLGFALLEGKESIEKAGKCNIEKIMVSGGASQSEEICQITADIFNKNLLMGETFETSGLGAAIIGAYGIGIYSTIFEAINKMVKYKKEFIPSSKNSEIYHKLYSKVYKKIFNRLHDLYYEIREITGYPEKIL